VTVNVWGRPPERRLRVDERLIAIEGCRSDAEGRTTRQCSLQEPGFRPIERAAGSGSPEGQPADYYEHTETGFNYRLSNVLTALGRVQLSRLGGMFALSSRNPRDVCRRVV